MKTVIRLTVGLLLGVLGSSTVRAESFEHVDELAAEVRDRANGVCWELYGNCRYQPGFIATYRDAKEMWSIASHLHDLVHNSANRGRIQRNVADLEQLLFSIRERVSVWGRTGFHGQEHGCSFRLKRKLAALEEAVQHLLSDVGVPSQFEIRRARALPSESNAPPAAPELGPLPSVVEGGIPAGMPVALPRRQATPPLLATPEAFATDDDR